MSSVGRASTPPPSACCLVASTRSPPRRTNCGGSRPPCRCRRRRYQTGKSTRGPDPETCRSSEDPNPARRLAAKPPHGGSARACSPAACGPVRARRLQRRRRRIGTPAGNWGRRSAASAHAASAKPGYGACHAVTEPVKTLLGDMVRMPGQPSNPPCGQVQHKRCALDLVLPGGRVPTFQEVEEDDRFSDRATKTDGRPGCIQGGLPGRTGFRAYSARNA